MAKIASYYDLDPQISYKNILTRCADETKKNNLYLTTEGVREVVEANKERVKIICSGPQDQLDIIKSKMDANCKARLRLNIALHYCVELISH